MRLPKLPPKPLATAALLVAGLACAPAADQPTAAEQDAYQKKLFKTLDADGDGKLTEKEFAVAVLWDDFQRYDADGDGKVTEAEYRKQKNEEDLWADLDVNKNGYVTFEECLKNRKVVDALKDEWAKLLKEMKKPGAKFLTLSDLPDVNP